MKPWLKKHWVIPRLDPNFVGHMEMVLDLYERPYDPLNPVICFDEFSGQLLADVTQALPVRPGSVRKEDYEVVRHGTFNAFLWVEPLAGYRQVTVTQRRTKVDFAHQMQNLVAAYPDVDTLWVVLDQLNTHLVTSLWHAFEPADALPISRKLRFVHTPKHASWLNMAEIEIGIARGQCLDRRLDTIECVANELGAWQTARNATGVGINWGFTVERARTKMKRLYGLEQATPDTQQRHNGPGVSVAAK